MFEPRRPDVEAAFPDGTDVRQHQAVRVLVGDGLLGVAADTDAKPRRNHCSSTGLVGGRAKGFREDWVPLELGGGVGGAAQGRGAEHLQLLGGDYICRGARQPRFKRQP